MTRKKSEKKKHQCPKCESAEVVRIVRGLPTDETFRKADEGRVVLGGCCCWGDDRDTGWLCRACGHEFGSAWKE
jgi:hypothetical protein